MNIEKIREGNKLTIALNGRLDTLTAPELEKVLNEELSGVKELVYDFSKLDYISSAGLRMLLLSHKKMDGKGKVLITFVSKDVMEVFELTGFTNILNIK